ncbi:DUF418 domain-containing protein, partial [Actinotalea sp. JY-7885]
MAAPPPAPLAAAEPPAPITRPERSLAPDVARGAMLLLIALANVGFYRYGTALDPYQNPVDASAADRVAMFVEQLLVAERSRPMFAVLYGFGLAMMASRMRSRGATAGAVRAVLARRSTWLVVLGVLHGVLLFAGDIIAAYGATGFVALALVQASDRALRRWLWGSLAYVAVGMTTFLAAATLLTDDATAAGAPLMGRTYAQSMVTGLVAEVGGIAMVLVLLGFVPLVVVGVMLQRAGWLTAPGQHLPGLRRVFRSGMAVNVVSALPVALIALGVWQPGPGGMFAASYATLLGGMYAGIGYVCGFALLAHRRQGRGHRGATGALAALGERSLTGYLGQSFLLAPLLSPWGLGLGEGLHPLASFGLAAAAWLLTLAAATLMAARGVRGPFEALLRRLTYGAARTPAVPAG